MRRPNASRGITVVEVVVAIAVFSVISSVAIGAFLNANALSERAAIKSEALWLAEEGIEATRSIRDQSFASLTSGSKGLARSGSVWQFAGASDMTDGFFRTVSLASGGTDIMHATSTVSWRQNNATSTVALASTLTNWRKLADTTANHMAVSATGACVYSADPRYMSGVVLTYDGALGTVTLPRVRVSWTPVSPARTLTQVLSPYPTAVWTGSSASNATTTLTTPVSFASAGSKTLTFMFNATIAGKSFVATFIYADGSTSSVSIPAPATTTCL